MRWFLVLIGCGLALGFAPLASAQQSRYCEKPNNAGAFLLASPGVSCATAEKVKKTLLSPSCRQHTRCTIAMFRCVAEWDGRFDRPFEFTNHALCNSGWRWIEWDGG